MVGTLLGQLALGVRGASWIITYFACVLGVILALFVIATLATIYSPSGASEIRYRVFKDLLSLLSFRKRS